MYVYVLAYIHKIIVYIPHKSICTSIHLKFFIEMAEGKSFVKRIIYVNFLLLFDGGFFVYSEV